MLGWAAPPGSWIGMALDDLFFISTAALQQLAPGTPQREDALLAVFDRNRARICEAATKVYGRGRFGISYDLTPASFYG